jgi:hypothetical protein
VSLNKQHNEYGFTCKLEKEYLGKAPGYELDYLGSIPGRIVFSLIQTSAGAQPTFCLKGTGGSFFRGNAAGV